MMLLCILFNQEVKSWFSLG